MSRPDHSGGSGQRPDPEELEAVGLRLVSAAAPPGLEQLVNSMIAAKIPVASQLDVLRQIRGVQAGSAYNGYTMAKLQELQGRSREEAQAHPATGPLATIADYLGADAPTEVQPPPETFRL